MSGTKGLASYTGLVVAEQKGDCFSPTTLQYNIIIYKEFSTRVGHQYLGTVGI